MRNIIIYTILTLVMAVGCMSQISGGRWNQYGKQLYPYTPGSVLTLDSITSSTNPTINPYGQRVFLYPGLRGRKLHVKWPSGAVDSISFPLVTDAIWQYSGRGTITPTASGTIDAVWEISARSTIIPKL